MTTLVQTYVEGLRAELIAAPGFPAEVESSPVRASTRQRPQVVTLLLGLETVADGSISRVNRAREVHLLVHTAGEDHIELSESVFEAAHPLVMGFSAPGIVGIQELRTDEPKYANGDLLRQVVTRRYLITYQTDEHSLSE
ncbi:hypothetical protein FOZ76_14495 [Verticiella sediminum]|uniref:DUF3168 domain-containing protein n=1 Tax=Verticiella sediminum TaxID=1247510 RepID=A0A556AIA8_9BURK|nr:hypothetical protein [Verticiella sediminum]TSH92628.1 hypothetical protein FOZ76_14495 [Verticiella sediminum]